MKKFDEIRARYIALTLEIENQIKAAFPLVNGNDISNAVVRPLKDRIDDARAKVEVLETVLHEIEASATHRDHVRTLGSFNWDARIAAHKSPIIMTCAKVRHLLALALAELTRLEQEEFASLTVDEVKARINEMRKGV